MIFSYKQHGQNAVEAKNLFLPISYDVQGAKNDFYSSNARPANNNANNMDNDFDLDDDNASTSSARSNNDDEALNDAEVDTILNFGQCPLQVLTTPHIQRTTQRYANIENSISRNVIIRRIKEIETKKSHQQPGLQVHHSFSSFTTNSNTSLINRTIICGVGYDINDKYSE